MEKGKNNILFTPSGCLTEKGLALFAHNRLPEKDTDAVRSHLQACELCSAAAEGYLLAGPEAFAEDVSFLNSGFVGLSFNEEITRETSLSEESMPAGIQTTKTNIQSYQYRLLAAVILLLVGFGSILLYLQFKHSNENNNTAALIERSDTISSVLPLSSPVSENKPFTKKKEPPTGTPLKESDSVKVITLANESHVTSLGYADHQMAGLIDRSSYLNREANGIAPTLGMPQPATPGAPQGIDNKKLPLLIVENDTDFMIVASGSEDKETMSENMDEQALKRTNMKTIKAEEEIVEASIFTFVEDSPHYPGGDIIMIKFLQENIKYPQAAREASISGTVYITFVVEADGSITDIRVLRGIGGGCDEEALRVIKLMPEWIPGKLRGKPVRVQMNIPVEFKLAG